MKPRVISVHKIAAVFFALLFLANCEEHSQKIEPVVVDFSKTTPISAFRDSAKTGGHLRLAIAAMTSPNETLVHYDKLVKYISQKTNHPIKFEQYKTYEEVNSLIELMQIDVAFICSGAYVEAKKKFPVEILAVPVVRGKLTYNAYIIVHKDSPVQKFEDLRGRSFAFTDPLSNTGRSYALKRVSQMGQTPDEFFSRLIYTHAHDYSIQAVAQGIVEGATVHSLIFDYMKKQNPEKVKELRIIEVSEDFGMPPVVVHSRLDAKVKHNLRTIFLNLHKHPKGKKILDQLLIDKFVSGENVDYASIQKNLEMYANDTY